MKHLFIVNPVAGGKDHSEDIRARVAKAFSRRGGKYEVYVTKAPMDAKEKIKSDAQTEEHLRVYACGGDGTFNECVCGAAEHPNVAVCPFPTGTGNDFCRMFGAEKDLFRDMDAVLDGGEAAIDLIDCNGRYSANICCVGIDARIGGDVHKYSKLPIIGGAGGYVISLVANVLKGINSHMRVRCGDYEHEGKHALVCACNGRYYGGGFNPSLDARPDDGLLDFFIVRGVPFVKLAFLIGKYASGRGDEVPQYITHIRGDEIEIDFDEENVINIDGESIYSRNVRMRLLPKALRLIVPAGMRFFDNVNDTAKTPLTIA